MECATAQFSRCWGFEEISMITVVTGFARSGTSLMMKMLHRGGMSVYAENHYSYEHNNTLKLCDSSAWPDVDAVEEHAVKISDAGIPANRQNIKRLADSFRKDLPRTIKMLKQYPDSKLIEVRFESLLQKPGFEAQRVAGFCGGLDVQAMTACVIRPEPECLPYILELELPD
jgi:hypothetical protein